MLIVDTCTLMGWGTKVVGVLSKSINFYFNVFGAHCQLIKLNFQRAMKTTFFK